MEENFVPGTTEFALLRELEKDEDGKFSYGAAMPFSSGSGKYYVTVMTDTNDVFKDSFWYMSDSDAAEELEALHATDKKAEIFRCAGNVYKCKLTAVRPASPRLRRRRVPATGPRSRSRYASAA